jgi:hypothetical protein
VRGENPKAAIDGAWALFRSAHSEVDPADARRCKLERYLQRRWEAGESHLEELTCSGLTYLSRLPSEDW